jgi:hypothetical protein
VKQLIHLTGRLQAMEAGAIPVTLARSILQPYSYWEELFGVSAAEIPFIMSDSWEINLQQVTWLLANPEEYEARRQRVRP